MVGIVAIAVAGLVYTNKENVVWNGIKLYDTIKDYYNKFQDKFVLSYLKVYNGTNVIDISIYNWDKLNEYLCGICHESNKNHEQSSICSSFILNGKQYCKLYSVYPDESIQTITDIYHMQDDKYKYENIQTILSATFYNGTDIINITEILQLFNIDGDFYIKNKQFSFKDLMFWYNNLKLNIISENIYDMIHGNDECNYIEIINIYGDIFNFKINDILKLE